MFSRANMTEARKVLEGVFGEADPSPQILVAILRDQ